jgi:hypothetical protein
MFVSNLKGFRAFTYNQKHDVTINFVIFTVKITLVIFTVKITVCENINFIERINYSISLLKM